MRKKSEGEGWEKKPHEEEHIDIDEEIENPIRRSVKISYSGRNQLIRIPRDITEILNISTGDIFVFEVEIDDKGNPKFNRFSIEKNEGNTTQQKK